MKLIPLLSEMDRQFLAQIKEDLDRGYRWDARGFRWGDTAHSLRNKGLLDRAWDKDRPFDPYFILTDAGKEVLKK